MTPKPKSVPRKKRVNQPNFGRWLKENKPRKKKIKKIKKVKGWCWFSRGDWHFTIRKSILRYWDKDAIYRSTLHITL